MVCTRIVTINVTIAREWGDDHASTDDIVETRLAIVASLSARMGTGRRQEFSGRSLQHHNILHNKHA